MVEHPPRRPRSVLRADRVGGHREDPHGDRERISGRCRRDRSEFIPVLAQEPPPRERVEAGRARSGAAALACRSRMNDTQLCFPMPGWQERLVPQGARSTRRSSRRAEEGRPDAVKTLSSWSGGQGRSRGRARYTDFVNETRRFTEIGHPREIAQEGQRYRKPHRVEGHAHRAQQPAGQGAEQDDVQAARENPREVGFSSPSRTWVSPA